VESMKMCRRRPCWSLVAGGGCTSRRVRPSVAPGLAHGRTGPSGPARSLSLFEFSWLRLGCLHSSELYGQGAMAGDLFQRSSQSPAY
jgi:hypothetical protein